MAKKKLIPTLTKMFPGSIKPLASRPGVYKTQYGYQFFGSNGVWYGFSPDVSGAERQAYQFVSAFQSPSWQGVLKSPRRTVAKAA